LSSKKWNSIGADQPQRQYCDVLAFGAKTATPDIVKAVCGEFWIGRPLIIPRNIARFPL
jgi:hypothetical protein